MSFQLFTPLFNKIDTVTNVFVTEISSRTIATITPVVSVGLTLAFISYGILIKRGVIEYPVMEFLGRAIKVSLVTGIALTGGLYQSLIADMICSLPDELVSSLISNAPQATASSIIDNSAAIGFDRAGEAFEHAGFFENNGMLYGMFGIIILLTTSILVAIGGAILLLTKLALAILVGLGPLFIVALLWQPTIRFFDMWVAQIFNYILLIVLFSAVFGLMMSIYSSYMDDMRFDGVQSVSQALGGGVILSIAMIVILLQLPNIAAGLAGGVSLGYLTELRIIGGSVAKIGKSNEKSSTGNKKSSSNASGTSVAHAKNKAYGYFKGQSKKAGR